MSRLTDTSFEDVMNNLDAFDLLDWYQEIYNKLAEYENTGLTPQEVLELKKENEQLKQNQNTIPTLEFGKCFNFNSKHNKFNNLIISSIKTSGIYNEYILTAHEIIKELKGGEDE